MFFYILLIDKGEINLGKDPKRKRIWNPFKKDYWTKENLLRDTKPKQKIEQKPKQIKETKCTCNACGKVWYYGKEDVIQNFSDKMGSVGNSMSNAGKDLMCCTGCVPALFIPNKPEKEVKDLDRCPECSSKAVKKEVVVHNVE